MAFDWVIAGGVICGALAGGATRFGRLCTMSAVEDALVLVVHDDPCEGLPARVEHAGPLGLDLGSIDGMEQLERSVAFLKRKMEEYWPSDK